MTTDPNYTLSVKGVFVPAHFEGVGVGSESITSFLTSALVDI